jgi:hypothetical protein
VTGEIINAGVPDVFRYHLGMVLDHASDARASVVLDVNYATGRVYVEPFAPGIPTLWRRIWMRLRYGYLYPGLR